MATPKEQLLHHLLKEALIANTESIVGLKLLGTLRMLCHKGEPVEVSRYGLEQDFRSVKTKWVDTRQFIVVDNESLLLSGGLVPGNVRAEIGARKLVDGVCKTAGCGNGANCAILKSRQA